MGLPIAALLALPVFAQGPAPESRVAVVEARGVINPVMARYLDRVIGAAETDRAPLVVITLDTPGGLETSMREINQRILQSTVPVAVFVYPPGARAGSAGVFITYSAHLAAMAPSTNIGSAHPVALGESGSAERTPGILEEKVTNDAVAGIRSLAELRGRNADWAEQAVRQSANLPASEALQLNVVDLLAEDVPDLLRQADGRTVRVLTSNVVLATRGAVREAEGMNQLERLLHVLSDPTIAYLLLSLGGLALIYELANPGAILPGVVGGIALLLALYSLGTLPVNIAGVGLILFALLLLFADLLVGGSGVLTVGGVISFALGSLLLATSGEAEAFLRVQPPVGVIMTLTFAVFFTYVAGEVARLRRRPAYSGRGTLLGGTGIARTEVGRQGTVFAAGEMWQASALDPETPIPEGEAVRVVSVDGLHLTVRPDEPSV